ncbi:MAG TPA: beta-N-acetylhexosaminidase [Casimicrobium huifangae]|jgi:beta-N-acetylhexosaminidase|uniref:beta-N-acetylhexosaminidase n=1 Tax=Casimicrobium huifangae TaxID=2591109 RepID=UPI001EE16C8F|nr:beta-N-acetylhexosaminidase [Casimicrobium huifangae]HOB03225.1 beta-N-acetylhexosaminidase [Casimicrobium huifangae]HQA35259.1 beta-N-acetylhexosaminidase [Casimicrobium huifangae]HQD66036.1 beta-N-acetylhexosaminidase [Casimicrobium huifangae]
MTSIEGTELTAEDREVLRHPLIGGVIYFARNFVDKAQLAALSADIKSLRDPALVIAVDQEGGRVQRFRDGFTEIPPMRSLGDLWTTHAPSARARAFELGFTIGHELGDVGVDFSFAPVLDLDYGESTVIGHRAFHRDPIAVSALATALMQGLRAEGMAAVGKHFPGHGFVKGDTHWERPTDERTYEQVEAADLIPFRELVAAGLDGVMAAHLIFPAIDAQLAGFSPFWLQNVLRNKLHFRGVIFTDDLGMVAAHAVGDLTARAEAAIQGGADIVLPCNDRPGLIELLDRWKPAPESGLARKWERMRKKAPGRRL